MELIQERTTKNVCVHIGVYQTMESALHWHENLELVQLLEQPFRLLVDGRLIEAKKGDLLIIGESTVHQFLVDFPDTRVRIMHMRMDCFINQQVPFAPIQTHITKAELDKIPGLEAQLEVMFRLAEQETPIGEDVSENPCLYAMVAAIYYLLMRHFPAVAGSKREKQGRNEFYKITEYINRHYTEDITVNSICKVMFMSRTKLTGVFRRFSGTGVNAYIHALRIKKANNLLGQGASITEAAFLSGFQSVRTFNAVYKKMMGFTPSAYVEGKTEQ